MILIRRNILSYLRLQAISVFVICCFVSVSVSAQKNNTIQKTDTVYLVKGQMIVFKKYKIKPLTDTIVYIPHHIKYSIKRDPNDKTEIFFDSLESKSNKSWFLNIFYNVFISRNASISNSKEFVTTQSESEYSKYKGKKIRKIVIKRLDPMGTSVYDTTMAAELWMEKSINALHIKTLEKVFDAHMIVKEGDVVNPYLLAENERIIRNLAFIYEAKFYPRTISKDSIDLLLITRDLWSIGVIPVFGSKAWNLEVYDLNYLGLGNEFRSQLFYDRDSSQHYGYKLEYIVNNFRKSFIDGGLSYQNLYNVESIKLFANRSFVYSQIKNAGGISFQRNNDHVILYKSDSTRSIDPLQYYNADIWYGRSFILSRDKNKINSLRLILSSAYSKTHFIRRPDVDENTFKIYHHSDLFLGNIALSKRNYYKGNLIYAFGTTEDIPYGFLFEATAGPEIREFGNRFYYGLNFSAGNFVKDFGYFYASAAIGGYKHHDNVEQGVLRLKINSFSRLYSSNYYRYRNFLTINYVLGYNRFNGEYIKLDYEAEEMQTNLMLGTQKLTMKLETVVFTPMRFYGFKIALYGFWDMGILGSNKHFILSEKYFLGLGTGLRIRNDNLVFQTFQINFGYYPLLPSGGSGFVFGISGQDILKLIDFVSGIPNEILFR